MRTSNGNFLDEDGNVVNIVELLKTGKATPVVNGNNGGRMNAHSGWFTDENGTPVNIVALIDAAIDEDGGDDEPAIGGISINGGNVVTPDANGIINLTISGDGSTVIDSELSASSTNPVQNKVVTGEINCLNTAVDSLNGSLGTLKADLDDVDELLNLSHTLSASVSESFTGWVRKTIFAGVTLKAGKTYRVTVTFSSINTVKGYVAISKLDNTSPDYYSPSLQDKTTATFTYTPSTDISANITVRFGTTGTYAFDCTFIEVKENVIDTIQDDISEIRTNLSALGEDCESFLSYHNELGTNLYNPAWYVDGEYIKTNEIGENASYQRSTIVSLPQGNYLINCRKATYGGNALIVRYYDESNNYLRQKNATLLLDSANDSVMLVTVESGESGIMFNVRKNLDTMILRGDSIEEWSDTYIPFNPDKKIIDSEFFYIKGNVEENPLYKKSLAVDGDSISYGAQYTGGYAKVIADNNSMTCQNLSVAGGTITAETYTSGGNARHWICRTMQTLSTDADFYIIEGGVNDSSLQVTLGTITNGYTDTLDDTTFYGALETIFKTLTTKYVGKKYMFVIPHRASPGLCPSGDYYTAVINCASKWGIKVLDLTQSVPPFNNFRGDDAYDAIRNAYTKEGDGWHPTELCYKKYYAPQIEAVLKSL